ncbi:ABC transporter ATP-binding protein [Phaeacidiphilus oryzae]|uniref:ABC transporter ATP-binding protein n=1 Tax=Phaeacidiphilus oryzae TaxID=348818 RepID=UPI0007C6A4E7|nr:ABC transporter ATP-binding protein [Phaeacidiphilus oryzae]
MTTTVSPEVVHGPPASGVPALEARHLTKHFPVHSLGRGPRQVVHAVEDVSLALPYGTVTAVVGESGSGKSTLTRMLTRLIKPTSGELLLDGAPVGADGRSRRDYTGQVQMVLQDPFSSLNAAHSVRYHLSRPLRLHGTPRSQVEQRSLELLERVALHPASTYLDKYPHELSGGQRQRVAIARALAVNPRVLLADEPVSMLDVSIRLGVLNLLDELRERERLAVLYVTHDIASARYLADCVVVMYAGQVVESGPAARITDDPKHPYTQLLLSAAPDPERQEPVELRGRGAPPSLVAPPSGCRFHPRCPFAMDVCREQTPPPFPIGTAPDGGRQVAACWLSAGAPATPQPPTAPEFPSGPESDTAAEA